MTEPRRVLALLLALNLTNYLDRFVLSAVVHQLEEAWQLSHERAGDLALYFILIYSIASPVAGYLGDRISRLRIVLVGSLLFGLSTFASGLANSYAGLAVARSFTGVGEACYGTVTPSLLSDVFPQAQRARALSIFYAAIPVGAALGYALGGWAGERWGWRMPFFIAGVPAILLGFASLALKEPRRGALDAHVHHGEAPSLPKALAWLAARRSYVANTAGAILMTFAQGGLAFWMPTYLQIERGLPQAQAGTFFGAILLSAGILGTLSGGVLADRVGGARGGAYFVVSGAGLLASAPFIAVAVLAQSPAIYWPAIFFSIFMLMLNNGPLTAALLNVVPPALRALAVAINILLIHLLGDAISPKLLGILADRFGMRMAVLSIGLVSIAGGVVLLSARTVLARDTGEMPVIHPEKNFLDADEGR